MIKVLLKRRSPDQLISDSEAPDRQMKRSLSAFDLTALGVGATIGAGIFALTGTAAAGKITAEAPKFIDTPIIGFIIQAFTHSPLVLGRLGAGPAIVISFLVAATACAFAALCYAELASMIPVSGSAYTYSYATLGELVAWIIGWDLILEYAVGNISVAAGWAGYFSSFLYSAFKIKLPLWMSTDTTTALKAIKEGGAAVEAYSSTTLPSINGHQFALNLPAFIIVALLTGLLIYGIKESVRANTVAVIIKVVIVVFFIAFGAFYVSPSTNWVPFAPNGFAGIMGGAAIVFFAFIGFDAVSTTAEEAKNPQRDMPIGMIGSLGITTILYIGVALVLTGMISWKLLDDAAPVAKALTYVGSARWASALVNAGALAGLTSVLLVFQLGQPRIFMAMARDGLLPKYFSRIHPRFRTPHVTTIWTGIAVAVPALFVDIGSAAELTNIGTLFAFILVSAGVIALRKSDPTRKRPFKTPLVPLFPIISIVMCLGLMLSLPVLTWMRFYGWLRLGMIIFLAYGMIHSTMLANDDERRTARFASASTASLFGIIGVAMDVVINWLLIINHPDFLKDWEFLAFNILLAFCNLVHGYVAFNRNTSGQDSSSVAGRNRLIGIALMLAAIGGLIAVFIMRSRAIAAG